MAFGEFGDLRSILHGSPAQGKWDQICAEIRLWYGEELEDIALPYVLRSLEQWPDDLRKCRDKWLEDILKGRGKGHHVTALFRMVDMVGLGAMDDEPWTYFTQGLNWHSLRHLKISGTFLEPHQFEQLVTADWFSDIRTFSLVNQIVDVESMEAMMLHGDFSNIEKLVFDRCSLDASSVYLLSEAVEWRQLHTLHLYKNDLDLDALESLFLSENFPVLRHLDLRDSREPGSFYYSDWHELPAWMSSSSLDHLQLAPWYSGLESLALFFGRPDDLRGTLDRAYFYGEYGAERYAQIVDVHGYMNSPEAEHLCTLLGEFGSLKDRVYRNYYGDFFP